MVQAEVDSVATILDTQSKSAIEEWIRRVKADKDICAIELDDETRSCHLPQLFKDLVHRLRNPLPLGTKSEQSRSAHEHGVTRREQGYSAAMIVEESRILEVSIFDTLQKNGHHIDFNLLMPEVMVIADEVDFQLAQAMTSYNGESKTVEDHRTGSGVNVMA